MKIIVALDSFKGGLTAAAAGQAVAAGLRHVDPLVEIVLKPMADGGEGTAAALLSARPGGEWIAVTAAGPLPEYQVESGYAWFAEVRTAVVEMAAVNGLPMLTSEQRDPLRTSTYGTGQLIWAASEHGARHILLAIGGSATVDGGTGAAAALGWRFLDKHDRELSPVGGELRKIARIAAPDKLVLPAITVLCDVTNPLCGEKGAARVFAPQKGATPPMVEQLEAGLRNLATRVREDLGIDLSGLAGGGAAGGLGAGAAAFMKAELGPGIEKIIEVSKLSPALAGADWCITGEGSFDLQSLDGKVVSGVARAARRAGVPTVVFAGRVKADPAEYQACNIVEARATHAPELPIEEVLQREAEFLRSTAAEWLREVMTERDRA